MQDLLKSIADAVGSFFVDLAKALIGTDPIPAAFGLLIALAWLGNRERALEFRGRFQSDLGYKFSRQKITIFRWLKYILLLPFMLIDDLAGVILFAFRWLVFIRIFVACFIIFLVFTVVGKIVDTQTRIALHIPMPPPAGKSEG